MTRPRTFPRGKIDRIIDQLPGRIGVVVKDLSTGEAFEHDPHGRYATASVFKLPIMVELFRQAEALAKESDDPTDKEYLDADFQLEFAGSLRAAGDIAAAESRLRAAIRGIPPEQPKKAARALRELARLWIEQDKNLAPAASLLKRAESLEPGNAETKELMEKAKGK